MALLRYWHLTTFRLRQVLSAFGDKADMEQNRRAVMSAYGRSGHPAESVEETYVSGVAIWRCHVLLCPKVEMCGVAIRSNPYFCSCEISLANMRMNLKWTSALVVSSAAP